MVVVVLDVEVLVMLTECVMGLEALVLEVMLVRVMGLVSMAATVHWFDALTAVDSARLLLLMAHF